MKIAMSILTFAATAGLALLALTARKDPEVVETSRNVDAQATVKESTSVPASADTWFV